MIWNPVVERDYSIKSIFYFLCFSKIVIFMINKLLLSGLPVIQYQSVIILLINKSISCFTVIQFCNHSYDYRSNQTPLRPDLPVLIIYPSAIVTLFFSFFYANILFNKLYIFFLIVFTRRKVHTKNLTLKVLKKSMWTGNLW